VPDMLTKLIRN